LAPSSAADDTGNAIVDLCHSLGAWGQLETNVTAYWQGGKMIAVYGTGAGCMGAIRSQCT
jgi:hypothetical protein